MLPQLSDNAPRLCMKELDQIIASGNCKLLVAMDNNKVVGSLTVVLFTIPMGRRARIEDLVVDGPARGQGIGKSLVRQAIAIAREQGADGINLTSGPKRRDANRLYRKMGFVQLDTNVYCYPCP